MFFACCFFKEQLEIGTKGPLPPPGRLASEFSVLKTFPGGKQENRDEGRRENKAKQKTYHIKIIIVKPTDSMEQR